MKREFVRIEEDVDNNARITILERPSWLERLFGKIEHQVQYVGSGTVWHRLPDFARAANEGGLCNIWARWERDKAIAKRIEQAAAQERAAAEKKTVQDLGTTLADEFVKLARETFFKR
jgi:hypothetical protein